MKNRSKIGLIGARSMVGEYLISLLTHQDRDINAFTRLDFSKFPSQFSQEARVRWITLTESSDSSQNQTKIPSIHQWLSVAPLWVLPQYFSMLESSGARRVVTLSSTSRFTKGDSPDSEEQAIAMRLADAEAQVQAWAESHGVEWSILRPTLIYGLGRDKNVTEIVRFIRRLGFFPLFGQAKGMRQPIHAQDVASACIAALDSPVAANRAYNLSGAETLTYRDMVTRIFGALKRPVRLLTVPLVVFRLAVAILRLLPRYRHWSPAMAERMNRDLVFDHSEATRDFGFKPRSFDLSPEDVGQ